MAKLFRQPQTDLVDFVGSKFVLAGKVVCVAFGDFLRAGVAFNGDLGWMEFLQDFDQLGHLRLALGREHIVSLHVEDVVPGIRHVVRAQHQHFGVCMR